MYFNHVPKRDITICMIHKCYRDETNPKSLQHPKVSMELDVPIIELHTLEWVCIRVHVQETWGLNHPLMDHTFELKNKTKLEN